ncbi:MAG TPA: DNA polymerase III subunit alpha, partial [Dehalococcoidia bacterium]|nr:DNA polymerase III subunit alpha [Dehalococcoidia bacterium]
SLSELLELSEPELREKFKSNPDDINRAKELKSISMQNTLAGKVVNRARELEGSLRNTGIHACGVIITPDDITKFVPVATAKDSDMYCTQYDNSVAEEAGLLKMDFLGLVNLTVLDETLKLIKLNHGIDLTLQLIPLDDKMTFDMLSRGETVGVFQLESSGMTRHIKELKPSTLGDVAAMIALFRPGPLQSGMVDDFINRKHGRA